MKDRFMRMSDGAYCPVCGRWIPDASNFREDYEQDEISMVIECKDCDDGRICPKCGKMMILCEDEKTYYQMWECDGCGYKEED